MTRKLIVACALAALVIAPAAHANLMGPRVGVSSDPDQIFGGGQIVVENMAPNLNFVPNVELGFGDNTTTIAINADFNYMFKISGSSWRPYVGGGLGVAFYSFDNNGPADDSETEAGVNLNGGATVPTKSGNEFFVEVKLNLGGNLPDLKALVGWNFDM